MVTAIGWHPVRAVDPGLCIIAWVWALVDHCDLTTAWAASFQWALQDTPPDVFECSWMGAVSSAWAKIST